MENQEKDKPSTNELQKMINEELTAQQYSLEQVEFWREEYKKHCDRLGLLYKIELQ